MADTDSVGSQEKQDVSVDNNCYMKLASKLRYLLVYTTTTIYPPVFWAVQLYSTSNFSTPSIKQIQFLTREIILLQMVLPTLILPIKDHAICVILPIYQVNIGF